MCEKCINGHYAMGQQCQDKIGHIQKTLHSCWRKKVACPVGLIDDSVMHIF